MFECPGIVTLLCQDGAQQILQFGNVVLRIKLQASASTRLRSIQMAEIKVSSCIEEPICGEVDGIEFEQGSGGVNHLLPLLVAQCQLSQFVIWTQKFGVGG